MVVAEPVQLDELEQLVDARLAPRAVPAEQLERQRDVLRDRAPLEQHRVLEDHAVVVVGACPRRRLAVDRGGPARRLDQVADDPEQRRLAAAGRTDQRDELPRLDRQVDVLEGCDVAALEPLRQALDLDDAHATCSGALCTIAFSARTTTRKNEMPSSAAIMFVAQRFCGLSV